MSWTPEQIKALREFLDMTQAELGEQLGYGKQGAQVRVSELERGKRGVSGPVGRHLDMLATKYDFDDARVRKCG